MVGRGGRAAAPVLGIVVGLTLTLAAPEATLAQQPQADLVARGQQLFEDQQYEESVQTLSAALLRPSNTKAQKVEIYRLLALDYITLSRKDEAESAVRGLLALEPTYALPKSESPRFRDFFDATRTRWEAEGRPGLVKDTTTEEAVTLQHASPSQGEQGTTIALTGRLGGAVDRVNEVALFYRAGSRGKFTRVLATMTRQGDGVVVRASIPGSAVKPPLVEYYLEGQGAGGLPVVARGDGTAPLRVAVPDGGGGWVLPVAIGGGVLGAAAIVGALAVAGVFKGSDPAGPGPGGGGGSGRSVVTVSVGE